MPEIELVELPPLRMKNGLVEKWGALAGVKAICTRLVWPGALANGLPLRTKKGGTVETLPVRVRPPRLTSWNTWRFVCAKITGPKSRPAGLTASCGGGLVTRRGLGMPRVLRPTGPRTLWVNVVVQTSQKTRVTIVRP